MFNRFRWPILIIFFALLAGVLAWSNTSNPLRPLVTFVFLLFVPGLAITRIFHFKDMLVELVLSVAISLAIGTVVAEFMIFAHLWSPNTGLGVLIGLSLTGAIVQIFSKPQTVPEESA